LVQWSFGGLQRSSKSQPRPSWWGDLQSHAAVPGPVGASKNFGLNPDQHRPAQALVPPPIGTALRPSLKLILLDTFALKVDSRLETPGKAMVPIDVAVRDAPSLHSSFHNLPLVRFRILQSMVCGVWSRAVVSAFILAI
jgi:hypothetical protein